MGCKATVNYLLQECYERFARYWEGVHRGYAPLVY